MSRPSYTLAQAARDYVWLYDYRHGVSVKQLAGLNGVPAEDVRAGISRPIFG